MSLSTLLAGVVDFSHLESLTAFQKVKAMAELAVESTERLHRNFEEAKEVLTADQIEEIRPLMDRIVPRAIAFGEALDAKLEQAKKA